MNNMSIQVWPFHFVEAGLLIKPDLFYGFGDAGSIAGSFEGYASMMEAASDISKEYPTDSIAFDPGMLGDASICIITGQQFIDKLVSIDGPDELIVYGHWNDMTAEAHSELMNYKISQCDTKRPGA